MPTIPKAKVRVNLVPYSDKQKMLTTWWIPGVSPYADCDAIIADGAIRSGKTMVGSAAFVIWAMYSFNYQQFGIAGKSLDSLRRNLWVPIQQWFNDIGISVTRLRDTSNGYVLKYSYYVDKDSEEWYEYEKRYGFIDTPEIINKPKESQSIYSRIKAEIEAENGEKHANSAGSTHLSTNTPNNNSEIESNRRLIYKENYFYLFGGKDEGSAAYVQGLTAAGFYFDECALMPESFCNQSIARCSVEGAKLWFNCNPEGPYHWFKVRWIDKIQEKNIFRLHFKMDDNPSLSEKRLNWYKSQWDGIFYQRFVLGEWIMAEGAIYQSFIKNRHEVKVDFEYLKKHPLIKLTIGVDWGDSSASHVFVATGITRNYGEIICLASEKHKASGITPTELEAKLVSFCRKIIDRYKRLDGINCDHINTLINGCRVALRKANINVGIGRAYKAQIMERIMTMTRLTCLGRFKYMEGECEPLVEALCTAVWDPDAPDERLDDGTSDIDTLDAFEYSWTGFLDMFSILE